MKEVKVKPIEIEYRGENITLFLGNKKDVFDCNTNNSISVENEDDDDPFYVIYITDYCNMGCEYCFNGNENMKEKKAVPEFSPQEFEVFHKNNSNTNHFTIRFFGGEPMLNIDYIKEMIGYFERSVFEVDFDIFTNGSLLRKSDVEYFRRHNIKVHISVFGGNDVWKGEKNRNEVYNTISILESSNIYTVGRMVWRPNTKEDLVSLIKKPMEKGLKVLSLTTEWGEKSLDFELITKQVDCFVDFYLNRIVSHDYRYIGVAPFVNYIKKWIVDKKYSKIGCGAGRSLVSISTEGHCSPCHCFNYNTDMRCGSIYGKWEHSFSGFDLKDMRPCNECDISYFCKAKCYGDAYFANGNMLEMNTSRCKVERLFIAASAYILKELMRMKDEYDVFLYLIANIGDRYDNSK